MQIWPSKRRWKQLAIGLLSVVSVLVAANGFMVWRTESRLQAKIAEIRAADDPASITDLQPAPIPADRNAAAHLEEIATRLGAFASEHGRFLDSPLGKAYEAANDRGELLSPEQIAAIRAIVEKYPDVIAGLAAASACDQYASLADFSLTPTDFLQQQIDSQMSQARTVARFNNWRMRLLIADGKPADAAEVGLESLKLARLHDAEPMLVNQLVGVALRGIAAQDLYDALALGPITPQLHAAVDLELARHDDPQRLVRALKSERAYSAALTSLDDCACCFQCNPWMMRAFGWPMKRFYVDALDYYNVELASVARPWFETHKAIGRGDAPNGPTGYGVLADLMLPALQASYDAETRNTATLRALRIFSALAQYRDEHGHEATGLEDLNLPKKATIDPFSGGPLMLRHMPDGWIVYSVMQNGVDDGGDFKDLKDYGLAPPKLRQTE